MKNIYRLTLSWRRMTLLLFTGSVNFFQYLVVVLSVVNSSGPSQSFYGEAAAHNGRFLSNSTTLQSSASVDVLSEIVKFFFVLIPSFLGYCSHM